MTHICHAVGCRKPVPRKMLMCTPHWFAVPKPLRDAVYATYVPGARKTSRAHLKSMRAAIEAVLP